MNLKIKIGRWIGRKLIWLESLAQFERIGMYEKFYREEFFYNCMRFFAVNHVEGDYLEFGVGGGSSLILAHKFKHIHGLDMHLYGFDSFEGQPKPEGIDVHPTFPEGLSAVSIEGVVKTLKQSGIDQSEYTLVPGFYNESLTQAKLKELGLKKAALVYLDCALYEASVPVLRFVLPLLQTGTVLSFNNWYTFNGDPERGEQLAVKQFLQQNPEIKLSDYLNFGWDGKSFIVKKD